ncbi:putative transcription factor C3H family [Lupinus albus]|uniref:Putative transcription factor C3H family n=1 Tax=Lupinus albus TaxID=3870 RepID=A0A6A4PYQ5_LUPAL|nr:putative transcription factor C3H family [Lupinus albus]
MLHAIPEIVSDPNLESMFESDEDDRGSDEKKQDGSIRSNSPGFDRRERGPLCSRSVDGVLNDVGCKTQNLLATNEPIGNICIVKNNSPNDTAINDISTKVLVRSEASSVALDISSSLLSIGRVQPLNGVNDKSWNYQDLAGKVQGPFSILQLYKWSVSGHFPPDLRIWSIDEKQDKSMLLTDVLSGECSKNVTLPYNNQLLSLVSSVALGSNLNSQDGGRSATCNGSHADSPSIAQHGEKKVDDQSNGKDESVRSNRLNENPQVYHSPPSSAFSVNLNENSPYELRESHKIKGNTKDNGNYDLNRTFEGQSNSGQSYQKQSDSEDNLGQSSGQNRRHPHVNTSSSCLVNTPDPDSVTKTSPQKLGFDMHIPASPPVCNVASTWQTIIGEPNDFDESVSDLLAEVEAMESLGGGLESPTSIMKRGEELADGSKNDCLTFADGLDPMVDVGKGDELSSATDLHLSSQSTVAQEQRTLHQADIHHHQRLSEGNSSRSSEVEVSAKKISVISGNQREPGEISPINQSSETWGMPTDTTWRLGSKNTTLGWGGVDQGNANLSWGVEQTTPHESRNTISYTSFLTMGIEESQTKYGNDQFSVPRDRGFHSYGRESGFGRGRTAWNRQPSYGVGNGGSYRPPPKGQRVCKFYESGYCKKGASCHYLHP